MIRTYIGHRPGLTYGMIYEIEVRFGTIRRFGKLIVGEIVFVYNEYGRCIFAGKYNDKLFVKPF